MELDPPSLDSDDESREIELFVDRLFESTGRDLRHYARASLRRRIRRLMDIRGTPSPLGLLAQAQSGPENAQQIVESLTVHFSEMFRGPGLFRTLQERVFPKLATYPSIEVWIAGCSSGEEAYSVAILLEEAGLYDRTRIYATDVSSAILKQARSRLYSLADLRRYSRSYRDSGGMHSLADYYLASTDGGILKRSLARNIEFLQHNLATDGSFQEFHLILCRNVMIYFDPHLQARVFQLLHESLRPLGWLGLGDKENMMRSPVANAYSVIDQPNRLFRRQR